MRQQPPPLPLPLLPAPAASPSTPSCSHAHALATDADFWHLFEEEESLGRGSFGTVLLVRKVQVYGAPSASLPLAAKVTMHADDGNVSAALRRYREADILRSLSQDRAHTNIVRFHDAYSSPTTLFVLMHAEMGGDLMARCEAGGGTLPEAEACAYVAGIAAALRHLHKLRIVHRDLKASNVLLSAPGCESAAHGGYPIAKLADFGLAACLPPSGRLTTVCGTHFLLAPEIIRCGHGEDAELGGGGYGTAVDLWSLGLLLHLLLLGSHPFERETEIETLQAILAGELDLSSAAEPPRATLSSSPSSSETAAPTAAAMSSSSTTAPGEDAGRSEDARREACHSRHLSTPARFALSEEAAALIRALLATSPHARPRAAAVLRHSWVTRVHEGGIATAATTRHGDENESRKKRKSISPRGRGLFERFRWVGGERSRRRETLRPVNRADVADDVVQIAACQVRVS